MSTVKSVKQFYKPTYIYIYAYIPGDLVGSTFAMSFRMDCWTPVVVPAGNATNLSLPNFTSGDARV